MKQASSTLLLLLTVTLTALLIYATKLAAQNSPTGIVILIMAGPLVLYAILSSLIVAVLYPLGALNNYVYQQVAGPESPFATERLPTQIISPVDQDEGK